MERLQGSPVLGWNDSWGVSPGGTTLGESFCLGMEQLRGSHSVLVKRLQGSPSVLGWKDPRGVILPWDGTTPGESFCPRMERLRGSYSVLGWNDCRGVLLSWDGMTPGESLSPTYCIPYIYHMCGGELLTPYLAVATYTW